MAAASSPATRTLPRARHAFRAMGTDVLLLLDTHPTADVLARLRAAEHAMRDYERVFTRFDPRSELRRLERARVRPCSADLVAVIRLALAARRASDGCFDPTVLPALRAAGYDRTFSEVRRAPRPVTPLRATGGGVHVDATSGIVALAADTALDLGGIAKGWIVDRVAELLDETAPALVDAGGDIRCTPRANAQPWVIDIEGADRTILVTCGAVASSGIDRRRWRDPDSGTTQHHVIDPRTGRPCASDLARVTTVARTCVVADIAATSILVGGSQRAHDLAGAFGASWRATTTGGATLGSEDLA